MRPSGAWGYGLIGFTLILLIRGWARGGGFSLILASLSCIVQAITEGVCVCMCVCVGTLACLPREVKYWLIGGLGRRHTRCYLCDLLTLTSLEVIFQAVCWWRMWRQVVKPWLCLRVGTCAMYSAWRSWQFIVCKNLKTVITSCGFTFSLCNQYGNW